MLASIGWPRGAALPRRCLTRLPVFRPRPKTRSRPQKIKLPLTSSSFQSTYPKPQLRVPVFATSVCYLQIRRRVSHPIVPRRLGAVSVRKAGPRHRSVSPKFANSLLFNVHCFRRDTTCVAAQRSLYASPPPTRPLNRGAFGPRSPSFSTPQLTESTAKTTKLGSFCKKAFNPLAPPPRRPYCHRMERRKQFGVYFIFKSMEQGPTFRSLPPKFPTGDA